MKIKRLWALAIGSDLAAFLFIACGGGGASAPTPSEVPSDTVAPGRTPSPTGPEATEAPSQTPVLPTELPAGANTGYTWVIDTVDDNGAKPSLAVDDNGVPHIAFMLESMPGFVKHAVQVEGGWDISTVSTGYVYGPLDIQLDQQGVPQISWLCHDEEDAAYGVLN